MGLIVIYAAEAAEKGYFHDEIESLISILKSLFFTGENHPKPVGQYLSTFLVEVQR